MYQPRRDKVFISFHHEDQFYKDQFVEMMGDDIVDQSVEDGDIDDDNLSTETIRQKIRDEFIRDATVTVVLIGPCTWQRKHVDWEIGSSLRKTKQLTVRVARYSDPQSSRSWKKIILTESDTSKTGRQLQRGRSICGYLRLELCIFFHHPRMDT